MLANEPDSNTSGQDFDSRTGRDSRVNDRFSVLPSQHFFIPVSACLPFVCTVPTKLVAHVKDPVSNFREEMAKRLAAWKHTDNGRPTN